MKSKIVEFPGTNNSEKEQLRDAPFYKSYRYHIEIEDHVNDYTNEIFNVIRDYEVGTATETQLCNIIIRAQYSCYLKGIYDERTEETVMEAPGMPERPVRIAPAQFRKASR